MFAAGGKLGPVVGDGGVEVQLTSLHQQVGAGGGEALGGGEDVLEGVLRPGGAGGEVGNAAPQVHHAAAVGVDTQRGAHFTVITEVGRESLPDGLETGIDAAVDG